MITFDEALTLHEAIQYDSMYNPRLTLKTSLKGLPVALDHAIKTLGTVELICLPWDDAQSFRRMWEDVPALKSVRDENGRVTTAPWLWGHFCTYQGIDCWASALASCVLVSGVRDLRKAWAPEDRVAVIEVDR